MEREAALKAQVEAREATVRALKQRLYSAKSEQSASPERAGKSKPAKTRNRGQQPGSEGHGRRDRSALPVVAEVQDLCEAFAPFPGAEASDSIAVQVQAHMRRIQRLRSQKTCECPQGAGMVTAPPAPRVIPQSALGVSVWTKVLLAKDLSDRPTQRLGAA